MSHLEIQTHISWNSKFRYKTQTQIWNSLHNPKLKIQNKMLKLNISNSILELEFKTKSLKLNLKTQTQTQKPKTEYQKRKHSNLKLKT